MRYLVSPFAVLLRRHAPGADLKSIDEEITASYMQRKTVLMFEIEDVGATGEEMMVSRAQCMRRLRAVLSESRGEEVEDVLWVFDSVADALRGALLCRRTVQANLTEPSAPKNQISGFGIHTGTMLFLKGTDVHWGDPVNTASKLGQDLATGGDILISADAYATINLDEFRGTEFTKLSLTRSKVTFECYKV